MTGISVELDRGPASQAATKTLASICVAYMLAGYYVEPPLRLFGETVIPAATVVLALPVLLTAAASRLTRHDVRFVAASALLFAVSAVLSPGFAFVGQKALGAIQTLVSILAGMTLAVSMTVATRGPVEKILGCALLIIVAGVGLEVMGPLRPLVAAFGASVYSAGGYEFYSSEARDIALIGFQRPVFFTSEPSLVAVGFMMIANSWLVLRPTFGRLAAVLVMTLVLLPLSGSPVLLISLVMSASVYGIVSGRIRHAVIAGVSVVAVAATVAMLTPDVTRAFLGRWEQAAARVATLEPTSENLRLVIPAITVRDVLAGAPMLGVGISGKEVIPAFTSLPISDFVTQVRIGNSLALLLIYLGVVGAIAFCWLFWRYARDTGIPPTAVFMVALLLSQTMGGFETPRFWGYIFLVVGALRIAHGQPEEAH